MKRFLKSILLCLLVVPLGNAFAAQPPGQASPPAVGAGLTPEQLHQQHQLLQAQAEKMHAERDALLRKQRASELKQDALKDAAERRGEKP